MASMESLIWSRCWPSRGIGRVAEGAIMREGNVIRGKMDLVFVDVQHLGRIYGNI